MDIDGVASAMGRLYDGDASKARLGREVATECADVTDADRCIAFFKIYECCRKSAESKGLGPQNL